MSLQTFVCRRGRCGNYAFRLSYRNSQRIFFNFEIENDNRIMPSRTKDKAESNENDKRIAKNASPIIIKKKSVPKSKWPRRYIKVSERLSSIKTNLSDDIINARGE